LLVDKNFFKFPIVYSAIIFLYIEIEIAKVIYKYFVGSISFLTLILYLQISDQFESFQKYDKNGDGTLDLEEVILNIFI